MKSSDDGYLDKVIGLTGTNGDETEIVLTTNYGRVFIDHINLAHIGDRDYREDLDLSVPEALALYELLKAFFDE